MIRRSKAQHRWVKSIKSCISDAGVAEGELIMLKEEFVPLVAMDVLGA